MSCLPVNKKLNSSLKSIGSENDEADNDSMGLTLFHSEYSENTLAVSVDLSFFEDPVDFESSDLPVENNFRSYSVFDDVSDKCSVTYSKKETFSSFTGSESEQKALFILESSVYPAFEIDADDNNEDPYERSIVYDKEQRTKKFLIQKKKHSFEYDIGEDDSEKKYEESHPFWQDLVEKNAMISLTDLIVLSQAIANRAIFSKCSNQKKKI
eukprot:GHVL01021065.1.p1 GENE.GHVL01021065.1~~GHVL01021065.1.p1  ORF type:complete len:211 (-),score=34.80 GHVL01021065.1:617-1249(-)